MSDDETVYIEVTQRQVDAARLEVAAFRSAGLEPDPVVVEMANALDVPEDFTPAQAAKLAEFDAMPPAPESFDATAAVRRVLALADHHEDCCGTVNIDSLREAVRGER